MGFLTSNRWLSADYGTELQDFLFDNFKINAVIDFRRQMFDIPLIATCITVLERCDDAEARRGNRTNLVHVRERFDSLEELVGVVRDDEQELGTMALDEKFRRSAFRQDTLRDMDRWDRYLFGPKVYFELLSEHSQNLCRLGRLADVSRGFTSGANSYFYFQEPDEYEEWGIEEEFVSPLLKHISPTEYIDLRQEDPTWYYLDTTEYVEDALSERTGLEDRDDAEIVKRRLEDEGYEGVVAYLEHGESQDLNDEDESPTVTQKGRVWFDIGEPDKPPLVLAKEYWRDARVLRNTSGVALDQRNYAVEPHDEVDHLVLLGVLNSSIVAVMREMKGREQQGQAMNRNELTVGDAEDMRVPDVRDISEEDAETIRSLVSDWLDREREASERDRTAFQRELDEAVLAAVGLGYVENGDGDVVLDEELLGERVEAVQQAVQDLLERREQGAGLEAEVPIGDERERNEREAFDLAGATRISDGGQSSITDW